MQMIALETADETEAREKRFQQSLVRLPAKPRQPYRQHKHNRTTKRGHNKTNRSTDDKRRQNVIIMITR